MQTWADIAAQVVWATRHVALRDEAPHPRSPAFREARRGPPTGQLNASPPKAETSRRTLRPPSPPSGTSSPPATASSIRCVLLA